MQYSSVLMNTEKSKQSFDWKRTVNSDRVQIPIVFSSSKMCGQLGKAMFLVTRHRFRQGRSTRSIQARQGAIMYTDAKSFGWSIDYR